MKHFKLKSLNMVGASHIIALMLVVVGVGIFGTYKLILSHADSVRVDCSDSHSTYLYSNGHRYEKYNCGFYGPTPVFDHNKVQVGTLHAGTNWILCQQQGDTYPHNPPLSTDKQFDNWWAWTMADNGKWGWVNGYYGQGGANNSTLGVTRGAFGYGIGACTGINTYGRTPLVGGGSLSCNITSPSPMQLIDGQQYSVVNNIKNTGPTTVTGVSTWPEYYTAAGPVGAKGAAPPEVTIAPGQTNLYIYGPIRYSSYDSQNNKITKVLIRTFAAGNVTIASNCAKTFTF